MPAMRVLPQTQSVMVLVGVAANVVLCAFSLTYSSWPYVLRTFEKNSRYLASPQGLVRVLFRLYRIERQVWVQAWVAEEQRHLQVLQIALQAT